MLTCVKCANQLTIGASDCPRCGYVVSSDRPAQSSPSSIVILSLGCAVLLNVLIPLGSQLAGSLIQAGWVTQLNAGLIMFLRDAVAIALAFVVAAALLTIARVKSRLPHPVPGQGLMIAGLTLVMTSNLRWYMNTVDDNFARVAVSALHTAGVWPLWIGRILILVGVLMAAKAASAHGAKGDGPKLEQA